MTPVLKRQLWRSILYKLLAASVIGSYCRVSPGTHLLLIAFASFKNTLLTSFKQGYKDTLNIVIYYVFHLFQLIVFILESS